MNTIYMIRARSSVIGVWWFSGFMVDGTPEFHNGGGLFFISYQAADQIFERCRLAAKDMDTPNDILFELVSMSTSPALEH